MKQEKIAAKLKKSGIVKQFVEDGVFGKGAAVYTENDPAGVPSICINVGKPSMEDGLVEQLKHVLTEIFKDEICEPELEFTNYCVEYAAGCPTRIFFNYSDVSGDTEYDYSAAKKYLEDTCHPQEISACCAEALQQLWTIHSVLGVDSIALVEEFNGIAEALQQCKRIADLVTKK